jgi:amidohydrolase
VTRISAGTTNNIIPEAVELGGTVRTYREDLRGQTRTAIERILGGVTAAHAAGYELDYTLGYDPVVNDPGITALVREAATDDRVVELDPLMAGDDFSAYLRAAPGCFFFVGAGGDGSFPHHHPRFTIDEAALPILIETMTRAALSFLGAGSRD